MMETNRKPLNRVLSSNTKYFILLALTFVAVSYFFNDLESGIAIGSFAALVVVLLVDYFQLLAHHHPKAWRAVKFFVIMIVVLLTLIAGSVF